MARLDGVDRLSATADGLELRRRVLVEVLAMVHTVRCSTHVPLDDELDALQHLLFRHEDAAAKRIEQLVTHQLQAGLNAVHVGATGIVPTSN